MSYKMDPDRLQQIHWNNNMAYLMQIDNLMTKKHESSIEGDHYTWFRANMQLYALIQPILKQQEDKENIATLTSLLKEIRGHLNKPSANIPVQQQLLSMKSRIFEVEEKLIDFDNYFCIALFKHEVVKLRPKFKTTEDILQYDNTREE